MDLLTPNDGVVLPALGLGVFQAPPDETRDAVAAALAAGYRHVDTAATCGNEREVGQAIATSDVHREDVVVETKVWVSDFGRDETLHALDKSSRELGPYVIDVVVTHDHEGRHASALTDPVIGAVAAAHGRSPAQVVLRWGLQQRRSVIPEPTRPERIAENVDVFDVQLTDDELAAVDAPETGVRGGPAPEDVTLEAFGRYVPGA